MRWIVGGKAVEGGGASTSQMGRFKTELLANNENLAALADLSGMWIDRVHDHDPPRRVTGSVRPDRWQKCHSAPPKPPIGPQSSGSARRWLSFEGELHVEQFRGTLNGLGGFHMGNPDLNLCRTTAGVKVVDLTATRFHPG